MYYSTMEIKPDHSNCTDDNISGWKVRYYDVPYDRESGASHLNAGLGFYHHSRKMSKEKAFNKLKEAMIKVRFERIAELVEDIRDIQKLEL
jgi:hypothetical protein